MNTGGLSKSRLSRMHDTMAGHVERGDVPGLVTLIARRGEVHIDAIGSMAEGGAPMQRDTIFRIASMTKPITAVAAMILVEECRLRLDEPVDEWLPELANRRVLRAVDGPLDDTVPAGRPITLRDLLTFRLGLGAIMVFPERYPIQIAMRDADVAPGPISPSVAPDEFLNRFGGLPLAYQPGENWMYHSGSDILGVLIARASGITLGDFLRERIFDPLGMKDTAFFVPEAKIDRLPACYRMNQQMGCLEIFDEARGGRYSKPPVFEAGGSGLVSTAEDYYAFSRMMLNMGKHGASRILSRPFVHLMTTDQLTPAQKENAKIFFGDSSGWGFGMSVTTRRDGPWSPGRFGWDGGYGTSAHSDRQEDLTGILLTQRLMDSPQPPKVFSDFWTCAYAAIDD